MCGVAGVFRLDDVFRSNLLSVSGSMVSALLHRGPDAHDNWSDETLGVSLAHARLSILDLSKNGAQPMHSACGRFVIVFNGEIYNHEILRSEIDREFPGHKWRGTSDTEVLLESISKRGLRKTLNLARGMFAIVLWDSELLEITLARDQFGEKPLYYGVANGAMFFASELKALHKVNSLDLIINPTAVGLMIKYGYVPSPFSIYQNFYKVLPGHFVTYRYGLENPSQESWLDLDEDSNFSLEAPKETLEELLLQSVSRQSIADVPLGAFLSGGIDSSLVVSLMQSTSLKPINTFTIGFEDAGFNEMHFASSVADHLGTNHSELFVRRSHILDVIDAVPTVYDEPFADNSQLVTLLLAELTKSKVTVSLSGDGADELFGGYNRYVWGNRIYGFGKLIPKPLRTSMQQILWMSARSMGGASSGYLRGLPALINKLIPNASAKLNKVAGLLDCDSELKFYDKLISQWDSNVPLKPLANEFIHPALFEVFSKDISFQEKMMSCDLSSYLADDILVKVDRASMAYGLELRCPFLDRDVYNFSKLLPMNMKINGGESKKILKDILSNYLPSKLIYRPKQGFGVPIDSWLKDYLMIWAEDKLSSSEFSEDLYLDQSSILNDWLLFKETGKFNMGLWNVLMYIAWKQRWEKS